jgi:hypothetical protein
MFTTGEDKNLKLLTRGPVSRHPTLVYEKAPYCSVDPACSRLNPYAGPYHLPAMTSQGLLIGTPIFQPSVGTSSSSLGASPDLDFAEDYPEIEGSVCWNHAIEDCHINMVAPHRRTFSEQFQQIPTIRGSKTSDARTPSDRLVQNLNKDFNVV